MQPHLCLFTLIISSLYCVHSFPCTFTAPSGKFYDLSPLSVCQGLGYPVQTPNDGTFTVNICHNTAGCGSGCGACQSQGGGQYNCGNARVASFQEISGGLILTYSDGAKCPNGQPRKSVFTVLCDNSADKPVFTFTSENPQCVYNFQVKTREACPKPAGPQINQCYVNVFLVPHTHDDVGWLKTIDGYYTSEVKSIIDTSLAALVNNPNRKFIYVEQAYFTRWWADSKTSDDQRNQMRAVVKNKQWEFVEGGWVMPDEAATTYGGVIDQLTLGHQFLLNTFGELPRIGWQIDPFGASSIIPVVYSLAGFSGHIIDRITDKDHYEMNQLLDFTWRGSPTLGKKAEIFTEIMGGDLYCDWLSAFDFSSNPVNPGNVASYGEQFTDYATGRSPWYVTPNVLAEWGCDFAFQNADPYFNSMDQLIDWFQKNKESTGLNVQYATLSEFFDAVTNYASNQSITWPINDGGDFFPYFSSLWWTGYFTSRVELKGFVRQGEAVSHVAEPVFSIGRRLVNFDTNTAYNQLYTLRVANGDAQHHDGVTGTSVPEVVQMYKDDLINGMDASLAATSTVLNLLVKKSQGSNSPNLVSGTNALLNAQPNQVIALVVFNSLGWTRSDVINVPINSAGAQVRDFAGNVVLSQVIPSEGGNTTSRYLLFFQASKIPPLGYSTFFVTVSSDTNENFVSGERVESGDFTIQNSVLSITFSSDTNRITSITNRKSGLTVPVDQNLFDYTSKNSGAYAFTPAGPASALSNPTTVSFQGNLFSEIYQRFSLGKQAIRLYNGNGDTDIENFIEIAHDIGPLPSHRELVTRFTTGIQNGETFYSDANGFQFLERTYNPNGEIGSNFYPMVYGAYIKDSKYQLSLISERSHGMSSLASGQIEVMVHRNPDMGDNFGPGLTDTTEVYPTLRVLMDTPNNSSRIIHKQTYLMNFPVGTFSAVTTSVSDWNSLYNSKAQFLTADLPQNIHLQALNALDATSSKCILRFTHLFANGEDSVFSKPVTINFGSLFNGVKVQSVSETSISANKVLSPAPSIVTINPSEIRTFVVTFS